MGAVRLAHVGPAVPVSLPLLGSQDVQEGWWEANGRWQAWWQGCERCLGSELRNWGRQGGLGVSSVLQSGVMRQVTTGVSG